MINNVIIHGIKQRSKNNNNDKVAYKRIRHLFYFCLLALSVIYLLISWYQKIQFPNFSTDERSGSYRFKRNGRTEYYYFQFENGASRTAGASNYALNNHNRVYNGRVLSEFCERVLAGRISPHSHILVVSPEIINNSGANTAGTTTDYIHISNYGPAKTVLSIAMQENHVVHALSPSTDLNSWWNNEVTEAATKPSWILLAYFFAESNRYSLSSSENSIDQLLHPNRVNKLLKESTITYIVIHVQAQWNTDGMNIHGLTAIQTLIDANYKVQILASSHYCTTEVISAENNKYGPNTLLKSSQDLQDMFLSCYSQRQNQKLKSPFFVEVLLFATQGLDLAIPSRRSYLDLTKKACPWKNNERCDLSTDVLDDILPTCPSHHSRVEVFFPEQKSETTSLLLRIDGEEVFTITNNTFNTKERLNTVRSSTSSAINIKRIWQGHEKINRSEAVCVAVELISSQKEKDGKDHKQSLQIPLVSCVTRVLPVQPSTKPGNNTVPFIYNRIKKIALPKKQSNTNLLLIMLDPMSRSQFQRSLPRTAKLLTELGFIHFSHYSAVGDNSGPNQAALFTGHPLENGRLDIRSSISADEGAWLWDRLQNLGYVTLKAEDGCIDNSNMLQSIHPQTTHGQQLLKMYCFDFDRPNCLGKHLAAEYLTKYALQFIDTYTHYDSKQSRPPWAAFLSFLDGHEDTLTLASLLDNILFNFIHNSSKVASNTVTLVLSDHGLHYGPYFRSIPGERERTEPILYIRLPESASESTKSFMKYNSKMWVTPFDVHETITEILLKQQPSSGLNATASNNDTIGSSLLSPLSTHRTRCHETPGIPMRFCYSGEERKHQLTGSFPKGGTSSCQFMPNPPSAVNFFSDIARGNRPIWPDCKARESLLAMKWWNKQSPSCFCATNERDWYDCNILDSNGINLPITSIRENFQIISCDDGKQENDITVHVNISRREEVAGRYFSLMKASKSMSNNDDANSSPPNILFIEVDSVSRMSADRLFPRTQQVLAGLRIKVDANGKPHCPKGLCSAVFEKTSVVGKSSISNQLAALSGCIDQNFYNDNTLHLYTKGRQERFDTWCPRANGTAESPWIFDIAKKMGYVTFFGEEFCYDSSPFVIQNNIFPLDADISLHEVFCRLASDTIRRKGFDINKDLWSVEHDWSSSPKPCLNGGRSRSRQQIAFDHILQMWKQYEDVPKLAFLNALAAHDYSLDLAFQIIGAEAYDQHLSSFLEKMINRADAERTIIIIRSDHGLQGGPLKLDYSTQIEHMNPWNNIIVPAKYPALSLVALEANQKRLVTGFDLYHTLRKLMAVKQPGLGKTLDGIPKWSFNLIEREIPKLRDCINARIPLNFCPCMNERNDMSYNFDVGLAEKIFELY
jgi:hypothetical protein